MNSVTIQDITNLYIPPPDSHKGQNGKLMIIGGSHLFHAASLWSLTVASRIVDLVHYSSVEENNELVHSMKEEFRNGIIVPRADIDTYIQEDDAILIGPGMVRDTETEQLTNRLLAKYPNKQWIIDAGALQMMDITLVPRGAIVTPHHLEFEGLLEKLKVKNEELRITAEVSIENKIQLMAEVLHCIVLLKGAEDIAAHETDCRLIKGGNAGMTKGGTGDVLAGLIAALACKNDPFLATIAGSYINKAAGDELYKNVGPFFNATDLADEIPKTMKRLFI
jgi:hydroxyethylthiazole kinase-like uncharacterized protein yjeF